MFLTTIIKLLTVGLTVYFIYLLMTTKKIVASFHKVSLQTVEDIIRKRKWGYNLSQKEEVEIYASHNVLTTLLVLLILLFIFGIILFA